MSPERDISGRTAWIAGWLLASLVLVASSGLAALNQDFAEPDNAMRLVRVRDMLAGQGWFDSVQHRLNPPDGTPMHWAQWIDALIAAPIALLKPVIGQTWAEITIAFAWPLGLLAIFMALTVRISGEIGAADGLKREAQWSGAFLAALAFPSIEKFAPGSFDHHNVELVLALAAILALIRMRDAPRAGLFAGLALGLAMATAAEGVPLAIAGLLAAGLLWLFSPQAYARGLMWMGLGLGAASLVMLPALVPPSSWLAPVCDAMGAPFAMLGVVGAAVALALSRLPAALGATFARRTGSAAVLAAAGVAALVVLFPQCLGGGYAALGEDMSALWMAQISETRSLLSLAGQEPALMLAMGGAAAAGLAAAAVGLAMHRTWPSGWIVLIFLLVGVAVLLWQIRGAALATAFAIPFGAWAVSRVFRSYRARRSVIGAIALAGVAAGSAAAAWASAGQALQSRIFPKAAIASYATRVSDAKACVSPDAFRALRTVAPGVMLNQFSLGAGVLVWTDHGVLSGPYHRNVDGTLAVISALRSAPDDARAIVAASAADYVLVCPAAPETAFYARNAAPGVSPEQTLSAMLGRGEHPLWLAPVDVGPSPLRLYRIVR